MAQKGGIKKALVVLSPDSIKPEEAMRSALLKRAAGLAKNGGCELELFHVCYDGELQNELFSSAEELVEKQEMLTDRAATRVAEIAARLKDESVGARHEVRWDSPRADAILRKIAQANPDIVMKQAGEHSFVLGITSNTDWELARRSPAPVWLVHDKTDDIARIVAAVGNQPVDMDDITSAADYDIFRTAQLVGDIFEAEIHPVNAYQVPTAKPIAAGAAGTMAPAIVTETQQDTRSQIVKRHSANVRSFAQYFQIPTDRVHICEGHPTTVIPDVAKAIDADMIVMGSNNISRLERVIGPVTVEPVIAEADCDVLIVRERDLADVPDATENPRYGVPKYDLERAITAPDSTFDSPQEVARLSDVSFELRQRILQAWEYDIRAEMAAENEGGPVKEIDVDALDDIYAAKSLLDMQKRKSGDGLNASNDMST